jgi:hypothetical protein
MDKDYQKVRAVVIAERGSNGMALRSERTFQTEAGPAVCFQFRGRGRASVVCFALGDQQLTLRYEGDEAFAPDAYEILKSARIAPE